MGRKSLRNETGDYLKAVAYSGIALECGFYIANTYAGYDWDYTLPILFAVGGTAARNWLMLRPKTKRRQGFAVGRVNEPPLRVNGSILQRTVGTIFQNETRTIKYREPDRTPLGEFYWWVPTDKLSQNYQLFETGLLRFCKAVQQRQDAGERHPMSRNYFLGKRKWRPRMDYFASVDLLKGLGLAANRRQGASGLLIYPPTLTVRHAKYRGLHLVGALPGGTS